LIAVQAADVDALEQVRPARGRVEAPENVHAGALAGAARAHDRNELAGIDAQIDAAQRVHRGGAASVDLRNAAQLDQRHGGRRRGRAHRLTAIASVITGVPGWSGPERTSVMTPSVAPIVIATGCGTPFCSTQTRGVPPRAFASGGRDGARRGMRKSCATSPPPEERDCAAGAGGVKRSAAFGTSSTSRTSLTVITAVAVMPGRRERSALSTVRIAL